VRPRRQPCFPLARSSSRSRSGDNLQKLLIGRDPSVRCSKACPARRRRSASTANPAPAPPSLEWSQSSPDRTPTAFPCSSPRARQCECQSGQRARNLRQMALNDRGRAWALPRMVVVGSAWIPSHGQIEARALFADIRRGKINCYLGMGNIVAVVFSGPPGPGHGSQGLRRQASQPCGSGLRLI